MLVDLISDQVNRVCMGVSQILQDYKGKSNEPVTSRFLVEGPKGFNFDSFPTTASIVFE